MWHHSCSHSAGEAGPFPEEAMMNVHTVEKPFRVGVFSTVARADRAIHKLLSAGFRKEQLSLICSDKHKEQIFRDVPKTETSGTYAPGGIVAGGAVGAALGGR